MKKLLTILFAVALGLNLSAQTDYVESWDPDADGDGLIGVSDLLALLSVFQEEDMDNDGIWDSQDDCVGAYDECGGCNGPGPQILGIDTIIVYYDSLYAEVINEWWVFEVGADTLLTYLCENPGCMDPTADNYDPYVIENDGSCVYSNGSPVCDFLTATYYDGYIYDLVAIGDECWFAENLRNEHYANGDAIPGDLSNSVWANTNSGAQAIYNNDASNLTDYGRLYNWYAVDDARGLCPSGWHVPTDQEYTTLIDGLGGTSVAGGKMKSSPEDSPAWDGTNTSGFSGLAGGYRNNEGGFSYDVFSDAIGHCYLWSASVSAFEPWVWAQRLDAGYTWTFRHDHLPVDGLSVRCVRD